MTIRDRIDDAVAAALGAGVSRAELAAELLVAAATVYDGRSFLAGGVGRRDSFIALAAGAHLKAFGGLQPATRNR